MRATGLLALIAAGSLGGCGLTAHGHRGAGITTTPAAPAAPASPASTASSALARAQRTHELPTPAPRQTVAGGWRTPTDAVESFADAYVNWNAQNVSARLRVLASVSVGQARSAMNLQAAETARDGDLRRGGIANSGEVEAVGPVRGRPGEYAVVTRERTTATATSAYRGLAPSWHVALIAVTRVRGLWVVSVWQPEN